MAHGINKRKFFNIFKINRIIKEIVNIVTAKKTKQNLIHSTPQQVVHKHHLNFSFTYLRNQLSSVTMLFLWDALSKINWNEDRVPYKHWIIK